MIDIDRMKRLSGIQSEDELRATALRLLQTCLEEAAIGNRICFVAPKSRLAHITLSWPCIEHARKFKGEDKA